MSNRPFVSVVIPAYNQAGFVGQAVESVLAQTYPHQEIILVDDGSTDKTSEVVTNFGFKVRYIYQENRGLAGARNTGILAAKGDLIGLLDADDCWKPNYLEKMITLAGENPNAAAYYCRAQCMDFDGKELPRVLGGPPVPPEELFWKLLRANFIIPSTTLIRRDCLVAAGLFDSSFRSCEDWDLWLKFLPSHQIVGSSETLVRYRIHGSSLSTDPTRMQYATRAVIEKHFGKEDGCPGTWTDEKRCAYGGVYRYYLLSSIQRQNDWSKAAEFLRQALIIDPTLSKDLDLFNELAFGAQPARFRGTIKQLYIEENGRCINKLLSEVFNSLPPLLNRDIQNNTMGTAFFAFALVAYNAGKRSLSRKYLIHSLQFRPDLWQDSRLPITLLKSFISKSMSNKLKGIIHSS
jgi:glycosyltransferase involved in cell wall biosynthesis